MKRRNVRHEPPHPALRTRAAPHTEARHAMKIALFLGAGASAPYGMPTTRELQEKIRHGKPDFPRKDLLDISRFPDIEHVLSALDQLISFAESSAGKLYEEYGGGGPEDGSGASGRSFSTGDARRRAANKNSSDAFKAHVRESRRSKEIIERLITRNYRWNPSNDRRAEKILKPLFDLARSKEGHITIFTTNYDTVIEEYCGNSDRHIERIDGFEFHDARRALVWDGKFEPHNDAFPTKVLLYKLHGSMSWLADDSGDRRRIVQKPDTDASGDRDRDMYIRPSLDAKDEATQREPYSTILNRFGQVLPSFDACIVIGYSFRDPHISKEFVKFAKNGKILVIMSPTAVTDFKENALKGSPASGARDGQRAGMRLRSLALAADDWKGIVCAVNERLEEDTVKSTTDAIRSAIKDAVSDLEADEAGPGT